MRRLLEPEDFDRPDDELVMTVFNRYRQYREYQGDVPKK